MGNPHPIDVHVGKRLRLRRSVLGLTQDTLGNAIGVTFQQIQKYERGTNRIGASRLYQFGQFLKVPVGYFFEEYEEGAAPDSNANFGLSESSLPEFESEQLSSKETVDLVRNYYNISSKKVRKSIFDLTKTLTAPHSPS